MCPHARDKKVLLCFFDPRVGGDESFSVLGTKRWDWKVSLESKQFCPQPPLPPSYKQASASSLFKRSSPATEGWGEGVSSSFSTGNKALSGQIPPLSPLLLKTSDVQGLGKSFYSGLSIPILLVGRLTLRVVKWYSWGHTANFEHSCYSPSSPAPPQTHSILASRKRNIAKIFP